MLSGLDAGVGAIHILRSLGGSWRSYTSNTSYYVNFNERFSYVARMTKPQRKACCSHPHNVAGGLLSEASSAVVIVHTGLGGDRPVAAKKEIDTAA